MLILVAHGTRAAAGVRMIEDLGALVSDRIGSVRTAFVDVTGPDPAEVLARGRGPAVVLPAFLASGYHVWTDLPARIAASGHPDVRITQPLGPDPVLAAVLHQRLLQAGWRRGDPVVMAAAGSNDPRARRDICKAAGLLARRVGRVRVGYIATGTPRVGDVIAGLRAEGAERVFVASYLLAPGLFHDRLSACGATAVTAPLGCHPRVVDLVASKFLGERVSRVA